MKTVTEFLVNKLAKGILAKTALTAEGKSPEEVEQSIGETFKFEGDKLKHFMHSLGPAEENSEKLSRILVMSFNEGEPVPNKAVQVEEFYYVPEFIKPPAGPGVTKNDKSAGSKKSKRKDGPKPSPWGMSPEEIAAKQEAAKKAAREKSKANSQ